MFGFAHPAAFSHVPLREAAEIADHFAVQPARLARAFRVLETSEQPEILLLQCPIPKPGVSAGVFFSSVWSTAYENFGNPYGRVHRDFHYQCLFCALATLVEVGCDRITVVNPMAGFPWRRDAYVCLMEATHNIQRNMNTDVVFNLQIGTYDPGMVKNVDANIADYGFQQHRPVGIHLYLLEGLNMRRVFVEKEKIDSRLM